VPVPAGEKKSRQFPVKGPEPKCWVNGTQGCDAGSRTGRELAWG